MPGTVQEEGMYAVESDEAPQRGALTVESFTEIFETYYDRIFRYIFCRVGDYHASEDLSSLVFERALVNRAAYAPQRAGLAVWLFAIAGNAVADYHRNRKKRGVFSLEVLGDVASPDNPEESCLTKEKHRELYRALAILREKERNIIALKYGAGLKNTEIAAMTGVSASNIGVVLSRSMRKLERFLSKGGCRNE
ncbi:MAG: sigma-70 family RNA polymerase sigma factor [Oscillospiraceae bacterium]|nr:sigma-70 family RNA polymerase sigma factor [Oscillospiraceae bacterium]